VTNLLLGSQPEDEQSINDFQSRVSKVFTNDAVQTLVEHLGAQIKNFENIPGEPYCAQKKIAGAELFKKNPGALFRCS
jgi:hypothetical protein